jgi:uncharacterized membrane protein (UPF0127 family)
VAGVFGLRTASARYYDGPVSDHFDGTRFFDPHSSPPKNLATLMRWYMGREKVGSREGMIFVFDADDMHSFWMKDCKVALDIVWMDVHGRVVWVAPNRTPCPAAGDCPSIVPLAPARYVLVFAAGTVAAESLKLGDEVVVLSDPPLR